MKEYLIKQPNHQKIDNKFSPDFAFKLSRGSVLKARYADQAGYYRDSGIINAENLDDVFRIGNCDHDQVEKLDTFYSISVGDIIVDSIEHKEYVVAPFGFDEL